MFDNQQPPEDILEKVDPSSASTPSLPSLPGAMPEEMMVTADRPSKLIFLGIAAAIFLIIFGVYFLFFRNKNTVSTVPASQSTVPTVTNQAPSPTPVNTAPAPANLNNAAPLPSEPTTPSTATPTSLADTDGDTLTDSQETQIGTNPLVADTDSDGLTDGQEINIYKTNPLVVDTDGDGFQDCAEVKNGYNPNGPGKLLNLPATNSSTNSNAPVNGTR